MSENGIQTMRTQSETDTLTCAHCGAQVRSGARFCPVCGEAMPSAEEVVEVTSTIGSSSTSDDNMVTAREMLMKSKPPQQYRPAYEESSAVSAAARLRQAQATAAPKTSPQGESAAGTSLACGVIGFVLTTSGSGGVIGFIAALILAIVAIYQSSNAKKYEVHSGAQKAGYALGVVTIVFMIIGFLAGLAIVGSVYNGLGALGSLLNSSSYYY